MIEKKKIVGPVFIPVTGLDMYQIATHMKKYVTEDAEIEFVDLSGIFSETEPCFDIHIEKLQPIMNVKKAVDLENEGVPNEIRFVIPNVDLPADPETELLDLGFAMARYVYMDAMPDELKRVVRAYLNLRVVNEPVSMSGFREAVAELAKKTEETFGAPASK